jgi:hypothetical protein
MSSDPAPNADPVGSSSGLRGEPEGAYNTLVISDLHLGEDLSPSAGEANTLHIDIVERQLISFLRYYARRREDGRPWRLIVNGDMVDFVSIAIFPDHPDLLGISRRSKSKSLGSGAPRR